MFSFYDLKYDDFNLKFLKSDIFPAKLKHAFTTRIGGDTPSPLNSFSLSAKDKPEFLEYEIKNKTIIAKLFNNSYENLISPNQQHTDNIFVIKNKDDFYKVKNEPIDGIITNLKNIPICLVFADCVPVLIFDKKNDVLACVHAGWKGTAKKIAVKALDIMINEYNSNPDNICVAIGSAICQKCFEVNNDVANQLAITIKKNHGNIFIENNNKTNVDLKKINELQLREKGVKSIDICSFCTSCNNDIFYSYRADNKCTGRHAMVAMIEE